MRMLAKPNKQRNQKKNIRATKGRLDLRIPHAWKIVEGAGIKIPANSAY